MQPKDNLPVNEAVVSPSTDGVTDVVQVVSVIAADLIEAARVVETSAIALAGEVSGGHVTHLLLLSQQLDRISRKLTD